MKLESELKIMKKNMKLAMDGKLRNIENAIAASLQNLSRSQSRSPISKSANRSASAQ